MTIPNDREIKKHLLAFLLSRPGNRAHAQECYAALANHFPDLTDRELTERYQTSVSKFANTVQFSRLHLVNDGLIYRAGEGPHPSKGVWILTPAGERAAQAATPESLSVSSADRPANREGVLLGWNRALWDGWDETYEGAVNMVMSGAQYRTRWSVGNRRDVQPGTDAWLLRQGGPYGLLGHGTVRSEPFDDAHFARPGETSRYVEVAFDVLLEETDILERDQLDLAIPEIAWRHQFQSGNRVPPDVNERLLRLWQEYTT